MSLLSFHFKYRKKTLKTESQFVTKGEKNRQSLLTFYLAKQYGSHFNFTNFS